MPAMPERPSAEEKANTTPDEDKSRRIVPFEQALTYAAEKNAELLKRLA